MSFLHGLFPGHLDMKSEFDMVPIMMNVVMMRISHISHFSFHDLFYFPDHFSEGSSPKILFTASRIIP